MNNMTSEGNLSYILWGLSGSVVCIVFLIYAYILSRRANEECGNVRYYMADIDCSTVFNNFQRKSEYVVSRRFRYAKLFAVIAVATTVLTIILTATVKNVVFIMIDVILLFALGIALNNDYE